MFEVVFRNGDAALQVLPPLVDIIPEARLNLIIFHLRRGVESYQKKYTYIYIFCKYLTFLLFQIFFDDISEALNLVTNMEPTVPNEYLLKAIVFATIGQQKLSVN